MLRFKFWFHPFSNHIGRNAAGIVDKKMSIVTNNVCLAEKSNKQRNSVSIWYQMLSFPFKISRIYRERRCYVIFEKGWKSLWKLLNRPTTNMFSYNCLIDSVSSNFILFHSIDIFLIPRRYNTERLTLSHHCNPYLRYYKEHIDDYINIS